MTVTSDKKERRSWGEAWHAYTRKETLTLLTLGFSAGLPLALVFSTLTAWLTEAGVDRATIGYFAWVSITYSFKFVWSPIVDRAPLPGLTRLLGRRRSWMLLAQLGVAGGLIAMAFTDPAGQLTVFALFALLVAFSSATQDIALDAYRIEIAPTEMQGALAAAYQFGYRLALLAAGAGALLLAEAWSWSVAYLAMAALMAVGIVTVLLAKEPVADEAKALRREKELNEILGALAADASFGAKALRWVWGAVIAPFLDFFKRCGWYALLILVFVGLFRFADQVMAPMANPFYLDLGFTKTQIAEITKLYGFIMTIVGAALGGLAVARWKLHDGPLLIAALAVGASNLLFWWLAEAGPDTWKLTLVISAENLASGFAGTIFIAYLSSLTSTAYTATQYALFSSLMTLPGKFTSGFSGEVVEASGYSDLFLISAALGIPSVLLVIALRYAEPKLKARTQKLDAAPAS